MKDRIGILVIHRDIPIDHTDENCVCEPFVIYEDDPRTPQEIVKDLNEKDVKH